MKLLRDPFGDAWDDPVTNPFGAEVILDFVTNRWVTPTGDNMVTDTGDNLVTKQEA